MNRVRCQCFGILIGLILSVGVAAASNWLPTGNALGAVGAELETAGGIIDQAHSVPVPLPLILFATGLLSVVMVKRRSVR